MPKYDLQNLPPIGSPLSGVVAALSDNTADHGDYNQTWRWLITTPGKSGLRLTESQASKVSQAGNTPAALLQLDTVATSTLYPINVYARAVQSFYVNFSAQIVGRNGASNTPTYTFFGSNSDGFYYSSPNVVASANGNPVVGFAPSGLIVSGNVGQVPHSSIRNAILFDSASAPTTDPASGYGCVWTTSGELQYRTATASEGSGQTNRVHNRTSNIAGAGTNYTLTTSWARIDFGTTDADLTLPTAGTYLLIAQVQYTPDASGAADSARFTLHNATDTLDIGTVRCASGVASAPCTVPIIETVTVTAASKVIRILAINDTANRGTITSTGTTLHYVRLS